MVKSNSENQEDNSVKEIGKESSSDSLSIPTHNWALASYVLGFVCIVLLALFLIGSGKSGVVGTGGTIKELAPSAIEKQLEDFINEEMVPGGDIDVLSVREESGVYVATISFQGEEAVLYITKDGRFISQGSELVPLSTRTPKVTAPTTTTQSVTTYSNEDLAKLDEFSQCLEEKGFLIYGANWCGYTKQVAELFGGFSYISQGIYVECTEESALCNSEGIQGYPTIKVNGNAYQGARTLEAFAQATGCTAPILEGNVAAADSEASC
jgi:hypothetical protein